MKKKKRLKQEFLVVPPVLEIETYEVMGKKPPREALERRISFLDYKLEELRGNFWVRILTKIGLIK